MSRCFVFVAFAAVTACAMSSEDSWSAFIPADIVPGDVMIISPASTGPSGTYAGEKDILGEKIKASVTIDDASHMDLQISGAVSVNCKQEAYTLSGNSVVVPGASKSGDCIHDALDGKATLESITYDSSADTITVKVKKVITINFVLKKSTKLEASLLMEEKVATTLNVTWKDCGDASYHVKPTDVEPKSLQIGATTQITGAGMLDKDVTDGASYTMAMTGAFNIPLVKCQGDATKPQPCKLPLGTGSLTLEPLAFPIKKGKVSGIPKVDLTLGSTLPTSMLSTKTTVTAKAKNGDNMFCVEVSTKPATVTPLEMAAGACTNDADTAAWKKESPNFSADMAKCGKKCYGGKACVSTCMQGIGGYSKTCADCMGDVAACTKSHCLFKCFNGQTPACTACVKQAGCDSTFATCAGVTPPPSLTVPGVRPEVIRLVYGL